MFNLLRKLFGTDKPKPSEPPVAAGPVSQPPPSPESKSWEKLYGDAINCFKRNQFRDAAKLLEEANSLNPMSPPIYFTLATTYSRIGGEFGSDQAAVLPWLRKSGAAFQSAIDFAARHGGLTDEQLAKARQAVSACAPFMREDSASTATSSPPSASHGSVRDFPSPTDGNLLAAMEDEVQKAIAALADNSRLQSVVTSPPWSWNSMEVREQASAADARRLAFTKLGTILGRRQKRLMDASYRMRFTDTGTSWDRDFGQPSSVMRIDYNLPGNERDSEKSWSYGVVVGKISSTRFLVWEWGD